MDQQLRHKRCAERGLTLVELLVVMLVVAMAAGVVAFNLPPAESEARKEAERFAVRLSIAGERAIMGGAVIAMDLQPDGYRFYRYERGGWRDVELDVLSAGVFPADIAVDFTVLEPARRNEDVRRQLRNEDDDVPTPNVFFSPTGETTAFEISFTTRRGSFAVSLDNTGELEGPRETRS